MNTHPREDARSAAYLLAMAVAFTASVVVTVTWCGPMSAMPGMRMPGGWSMSMAWMRMPGQGWGGAATTFLGMWTVMMVAMMLPTVTPVLLHRPREARLPLALGYFSVWIGSGLAIFALGVGLADLEMRHASLAQAVPSLSALAVMSAGAWQLTAWKARQLSCCRASARRGSPDCRVAPASWRAGVALGQRCFYCCGPFTALLLALGVMQLWVMALVTAAITLERTAPEGWRIATLAGVSMLAAGSCLLCLAA